MCCQTCLSHLSTEALLVFGHHLGGHEGRRPRRARQEGIRPLKLVAHAKVCDLDVTVVAQQQVGGFDVPVDDLVVVHWKVNMLIFQLHSTMCPICLE